MKKLIYSAAAMALAFFAASCQQENLEPGVKANTVTYTVQVADAVATRAIGDDVTAVNELVYEVYRTKEEETTSFTDVDHLLYHKTAEVKNGVATIEIEFVNDQNFTVLFWAHTKDNGVYNVENLTNVTITSPDVANNVNAQAFVGRDFVKDCVSDANGKVTLHRPVSQLNIATTPESLVFEAEAGERGSEVVLEGSSVKVTGLATSYNIATLSAFGATATEYTYTEEDVPADVLTVNGKNYTYVAMNYVGFAPEMGTSDVTVSYVINTSEGNIDNEILNVPVKPNYRTNIIGNLITSKNDYTITLEKTWGELPPVEVVTNATGLQQAINEIPAGGEGEIVLDGDINLSELFAELTKSATQDITFLTVPAGKEVVLNLNGYSLTGVDETEKSFGLIQNNGNLTVKNTAKETSKISLIATHNNGWNRYSAVISNNPGAELSVEGNIVIEHLGGTDMAYGIDNLTNGGIGNVKATINGATIKSTYRAVRQFLNSDSKMNELIVKRGSTLAGKNKGIFFQDPSANANNGKLVVEDGAYIGTAYLYVCEGSTSWPVEVSIAASAVTEGGVTYANLPKGYAVENVNDNWTVVFHPVAKIGEKGYATLIDAVAAVQDGETITLVADEIFTETNRSNNGGWWDGLAYSGDKSFTIDLGGHTIKQDGSLNDYLMWIKNDGAKANTITLKNGTMDAGKTAYSAFATASSNTQKITVNLENINLINNISNGAVVKARGGSVLNVNAGTVITGKDSYVGIEAVGNNTVVNVYDGAKIYQNGTSSYVGAIIGASYNATLNIYGGEGKSAKCGIIVMSTGATINVSGGEWTANGDGSVAAGNNGVLVSQNNRYESAWACKSVLNVTGGTFKGGYDCWGMGPGQEPDDAQINIKGGNFNANPTRYLAEGYRAVENNGIWTVSEVLPAAMIGNVKYENLAAAFAAVKEGETVKVCSEITETVKLPATLKNVTIKGEAECLLKDMTISAADGNSVNYEGLTFDGLTFDNSNIVLTGWRTSSVVYKNLTVTNCTFRNIVRTNNEAALHINCDATEAVNGFVFTNNTIDGVSGASNSGVYAQVTGEILVSGNKINNVAFRPYVIQVTIDDGIADNFVVTDNTFSGSSVGRAQGLGNNAEGTDQVNLVVSQNIFKGITESQQICYWNFNAEKTTAALSHNYYDIDIAANPSRIYYNKAASSVEDLVAMGIYPIYKELNADGTINTNSLHSLNL